MFNNTSIFNNLIVLFNFFIIITIAKFFAKIIMLFLKNEIIAY